MAEQSVDPDTGAVIPAQPAVPRDASTVVLIRDGGDGVEVFLQRRVKTMAFAGGMTVFPGGGVDARDAEAHISWSGPDADWWARTFGATEPVAQALVCAAVRETFEECGVLFATDADGRFPEPGVFADARAQLVDKSESLAGFLAANGLTLRADLIAPLAHWIAPVIEKRRYDTRFFVAALPEGQHADGETSEVSVAGWLSAREALNRWVDKQHFVLPPTWSQLREIARFETVAELLAEPREISMIMPDATTATMSGLRFPHSDKYFVELDGRLPSDASR
ncbi:8-oxo-dGTP pyrophosphatase MutT (NUDIX family) [Gordonia amarae]|uniref:Nudix hydrolase domain-containing protein n=1 Tax=Gordonia amarae NBRC 15530 TaxID=1075090 RepID=G7GVE6_9ACTN|nr:NUDIX domain-containing protein [Gordonia amarae]MCS3879917.1 8-oxo-dGTP pyrophosphatase MutT (NUDIX family) [Gordonia amarae]GAB07571.1 hypothetical protein GOAMR_69_00900 [Gordonia amarae NBRC 15530]